MISNIVRLFGILILPCCGIVQGAEKMNPSSNNATLVYVGTFTGTPAASKGIYSFSLKSQGAETSLVPMGVAAETQSPTFLAVDSKRQLLFCANEVNSYDGKPTGAISSFSIDSATGKLTLINQRPSMGASPCHIVLDKTGKNLLVANYASGTAAVLPVGANGELGEATSVVQDTGKGPNSKRQEGPHAHCVALSPDNRFAFVCDLGIDKVMIFKLDAEHGKLIPNDPPFAQTKPGAGPRHITFHPNGKFAYLINELDSTVSAFAYDAKTGALKEMQTLSALPNNFKDFSKAAEIAVASSGKFLYVSNRGRETVVAFAIDPEKGTLHWVEEQNCGGKSPRHFGITPSGKYMLVCNQDSDSVVPYSIDVLSGRLKQDGPSTKVPAAVCAVFLPKPSVK